MGIVVRFNIISYFLSEGISNVFKNKKSTFACLSVMCATMLMFGLFYAIGENITNVLRQVESEQGMQVFMVREATEADITRLREELRGIDGINDITPVTSEEAFEIMQNRLGDRRHLMAGHEPTMFPFSFIVTLTDLNLNDSVQYQISGLSNVDDITSRNDTINALANIGGWIRAITLIILLILIMISVFIISNTIKLTVHARRKEISIMKYVGATNGFIRTPFIIEGIIIGLLSGLFSIVLVSIGYTLIEGWTAPRISVNTNINVRV